MQPIKEAAVGAMLCDIILNNTKATVILDTGSGVSLVSDDFVNKTAAPIKSWDGPLVTTVSGNSFSIPSAARLTVDIMGHISMVTCGIVPGFPFSALLGMDFLIGTPF